MLAELGPTGCSSVGRQTSGAVLGWPKEAARARSAGRPGQRIDVGHLLRQPAVPAIADDRVPAQRLMCAGVSLNSPSRPAHRRVGPRTNAELLCGRRVDLLAGHRRPRLEGASCPPSSSCMSFARGRRSPPFRLQRARTPTAGARSRGTGSRHRGRHLGFQPRPHIEPRFRGGQRTAPGVHGQVGRLARARPVPSICLS